MDVFHEIMVLYDRGHVTKFTRKQGAEFTMEAMAAFVDDLRIENGGFPYIYVRYRVYSNTQNFNIQNIIQ